MPKVTDPCSLSFIYCPMASQSPSGNVGIICFHRISTPSDAFVNALTKTRWYFHQNYTRKTVADRPLWVAQWPAIGPEFPVRRRQGPTPVAVPENIRAATDCQGFMDMVVVNPSETSSSALPLPQSELDCVCLVTLNKAGLWFLDTESLSMSQPLLLPYVAELCTGNCRNEHLMCLTSLCSHYGTYSYWWSLFIKHAFS